MTHELRVMCGIPASGKSTIAKELAEAYEDDGYSVAIISRDTIRKKLIGDTQEGYFSRETDVFNEFIEDINQCLEVGIEYILVDATHLTKGSRTKLLRRLAADPSTTVVFDVVECDLSICLERNSKRTGFERVPDDTIREMYQHFVSPTVKEFKNHKYGFKDVVIRRHWGGD